MTGAGWAIGHAPATVIQTRPANSKLPVSPTPGLRDLTTFDNPDFVDVVVHSYRVRYGLAEPDPAYADLERRLSGNPDIRVPVIVLDCAADGVEPVHADQDPMTHFTGPSDYRLLQDTGHNTPQEAPAAVAQAVLDVRQLTDQ